jgi:transposase
MCLLNQRLRRSAPISLYGVGPDTAATLLVALGDNPERIGSDAAFAKLCGVSPIEASSGKIVRHRLNRGGNLDANRALHVICVVRLRRHQPTRDYLARRIGEGRTKPEIMRCIKRYIAREIYHAVLPTRQKIPTPNRCHNIGASAIEGCRDIWLSTSERPISAVE